MLNSLAYLILLACCLSSLVLGKRWVLLGLAALCTWVQVMPSPFGFVLSPVNAILLGLGGLLVRAVQGERHTGHTPLGKVITLWIIVLFIGCVRTTIMPPPGLNYSISPDEVWHIGWYWTTPFIIYYMVHRLVATRALAEKIVMAAMASSVIEALLAMYERLQGVGRATAHLGEPNRAGAYFAGVAVFFFAFVLLQSGRKKLLFMGAWCMAMGALFATLSRGGMLSTAVGCMVLFIAFLLFSEHKGAAAKFNYMILGVLLVANIALVLPERVMNRLLITVQGDPRENVGIQTDEQMDSSSEDRLALWTVGLRLFREQPSGYGAFTAEIEQSKYRGVPKAMHNIYLQVLVEHGIQGLACLLLLIGTVVRTLWRRFRRCREVDDSALFLGLMGYWIALCVAHFFVNPFFMLQLNGQFWVMTACALRHGAGKEEAA